jgi:hypothetical protein
MNDSSYIPGSFRDPSGALFIQNGSLYRRINPVYKEQYDRLMNSGLYGELAEAGLLIPHTEVDLPPQHPGGAYKVIQPELALIHHLAVSNNVPLERIALFFQRARNWLIAEFVSKTDSQVQQLLRAREDVFPDYTREGFETAFKDYFKIIDARPIPDSERILYLMKKE